VSITNIDFLIKTDVANAENKVDSESMKEMEVQVGRGE